MSAQTHIISGFVGASPETREVETAAGEQRVTTMTVAVNNNRRKDAPPTWYRVTMWNGLGDTVCKYVDKGFFVICICDRLTASAWINEQGEPMATLEATASSIDFSMNRRNGDSENAPVSESDIPF
jgi:single-stranded DNA-binding protein